MAFVLDALDAAGGKLDLDAVELGDADQLLRRPRHGDLLFVAGCVEHQVVLVGDRATMAVRKESALASMKADSIARFWIRPRRLKRMSVRPRRDSGNSRRPAGVRT